MIKFLIPLLTVGLIGCCPPNIRPEFPKIPPELAESCPDLILISPTTKLSDVVDNVTSNYGYYHECKFKVQAWNEWYVKQRDNFNGVK